MSLRKKSIPIPEASRYDRMSAQDLTLGLEAAVFNTNHMLQTYQQRLGEPEQALALLQSHAEEAVALAKALRRKLVVNLPNI